MNYKKTPKDTIIYRLNDKGQNNKRNVFRSFKGERRRGNEKGGYVETHRLGWETDRGKVKNTVVPLICSLLSTVSLTCHPLRSKNTR